MQQGGLHDVALDVPRELIEAGFRGRLTIFVGAGASYGSGLPSWPELVGGLLDDALKVKPLAREMRRTLKEVRAQIKRKSGNVDLTFSASLARRAMGEPPFRHAVAKRCSGGAPSPRHALLAKIEGVTWVTTNYDQLLEQALTERTGRAPVVVLPDDTEGLASLGQGQVLKLHGDVSRPDSIVLTVADYVHMSHETAPAWKRVVESLFLQGGQVLLVGYGYADTDVHAVVNDLRAAFQGSLPGPFWLEPRAIRTEIHAEENGLRLLSAAHGEEQDAFLHELAKKIRERHAESGGAKLISGILDSAATGLLHEELNDAGSLLTEGRWLAAQARYARVLHELDQSGTIAGSHSEEARAHQRARARATQGWVNCAINLGKRDEALQRLRALDLTLLDRDRLAVHALLLIGLGRLDDAEQVLQRVAGAPLLAEEDLRTKAEVNHRTAVALLGMERGEIPHDLDLDNADIRYARASFFLRKGDNARAVGDALALLATLQAKPLIGRYPTCWVLVNALRNSIFEIPPLVSTIPDGALRDALAALDRFFMDALQRDDLPAEVRQQVDPLALGWANLLGERWEPATPTMGSPAHDPAEAQRLELARQARWDEADALVPPAPNAWLHLFNRAMIRKQAGRVDLELEVLQGAWNSGVRSVPLASALCEALQRFGRHQEALPLGELTWRGLPSRDNTILYAQALKETGREEEAWKLLAPSELWAPWLNERSLNREAGAHLLRLRADSAFKTDRLKEGHESLSLLLMLFPGNPLDRLGHAGALARLGQREQAGRAAEAVLRDCAGSSEVIPTEALADGWRLVRVGLARDHWRDAARDVLTLLGRQTVRDAASEALRLRVLKDADLPDQPPPDMDLLVEAGIMRRVSSEQLLTWQAWNQGRALRSEEMYRHGTLSFPGLAALWDSPDPAAFERLLLRASGGIPPLVTPAMASPRTLQGPDILGATVLLDMLSLLVLHEVDAMDALNDALGPMGRLAILRSDWDALAMADVQLQLEFDEAESERLRGLIESLDKHAEIHRGDPNRPLHDEQSDADFAARSGATRVTTPHEPQTWTVARLARALLKHGRLSDRQASALGEPTLTPEVAGDELPGALSPDVQSLVLLQENGALTALIAALQESGQDEKRRLHISPRTWRALRDRRDTLEVQKRAAERARRLHFWLGNRLSEDRLVTWSPEPDLKPPPFRAWHPNNALIEEELDRQLGIPRLTLQMKPAIVVVADALISTWLGDGPIWPELRHFQWTSLEQVADYRRHWAGSVALSTLPQLVTALSLNPGKRAERAERLAELGFPDALDAERIQALDSAYTSLTRGRPAELIRRASWRACSEISDAVFARVQLTGAWSAAIFAQIESGRWRGLLDAALEHATRLEQAGAIQHRTWMMQAFLTGSLTEGLDAGLLLRGPAQDGLVQLQPNHSGPYAALWSHIGRWTREHPDRAAALATAVRATVNTLRDAALDEGTARRLGMNLSAIADLYFKRDDTIFISSNIILEALSLCPSEVSSAALTSATLSFPGGDQLNLETVLKRTAVALMSPSGGGGPPDMEVDGRSIYTMIPVGQGHLQVRAEIEAVYARLSGADQRRMSLEFAAHQGIHDGELGRLLLEIHEHGPSEERVRSYLNRALASPMRSVRESPSVVAAWNGWNHLIGNVYSIAGLRALLSEPGPLGPLGARNLQEVFADRLAEGGPWAKLCYAVELLGRAHSVPGLLTVQWARWLLVWHREDFGDMINDSYSALQIPDTLSAGELASNLAMLRLAAANAPHVNLPEGTRDLREVLPTLIHSLLKHIMSPPQADTVPGVEADLLRVCGAAVDRLALIEHTNPADRLWLTWQLSAWVLLQLRTLPTETRQIGMRSIAREAARLPDREAGDPLSPWAMGPDRLDIRCGALLIVLLSAQIWEGHAHSKKDGPLPFDGALTAESLELVVSLASRPLTPTESALRVQPDLLGVWIPHVAIPDLALAVLLHHDRASVLKLTPELRTARLQELMLAPAASHLRTLGQQLAVPLAEAWEQQPTELQELLAGAAVDGRLDPRTEVEVRVNLLKQRSGELDEVLALLSKNLDAPGIGQVFGRLLLTLADHAPDDLPRAITTLRVAARAAGTPEAPWVLALQWPIIKASPEGRRAARAVFAEHAKTPEIAQDLSVRELRRRLGL